jgi:hypothetical protein
MKCKLDTDRWDDLGVIYTVISSYRRPNSTAVELTLEKSDGTQLSKVVAVTQIEWIEDDEG